MAAGAPRPETQAEPTRCANCTQEIENRGTPSMDGNHHVRWVHVPGGYAICHPQQPNSPPRHARATPATRADALSDTERAMLRYALELVGDRIASEGDEFTDDDRAAVDSLARLAGEADDPTPLTPQAQPEGEPRGYFLDDPPRRRRSPEGSRLDR